MPRFDESRQPVLDALLDHYGPLPIPGGGPTGVDGPRDGADFFEAIASVVLGLIAEPRAASAALEVLRDAGLLDPKGLAEADPAEVDDVLKQGRARVSGRSLRPLVKLARWAAADGFDAERSAAASTEALREAWRGLNGVGPATADVLLLFALGRSTYPVDRATYRVLTRHGWLDPSADYDEARAVAEAIAPDDPASLARLSVAMERLGRDFCKPGSPRCDRCPLRPFLPEGGPRQPE